MSRSRHTVELIGLIDDDDYHDDVDDRDDDVDVRRPSRPPWMWALVGGVVSIVVVCGVIAGRADIAPTSVPLTARPIVSPPSVPPTPPPARVLNGVGGPVHPFGHGTGAVVYLSLSGGAHDGLLAYDIDSGRFSEIDLHRDVGWFVRVFGNAAGLFVDGGDVLRISATHVNAIAAAGPSNRSYFDAPYGRLAPGPEQGTWLRTLSPPGVVLIDDAGKRTDVRYDLPLGAVLYGSLADGRPVVRGADQRSLIIETDARHSPLASGPTSIVEHGRFIETTCDDALRCSYVAHVDATTRALGRVTTGSETSRSFRFQPDGPLIAIVRDRELSILDVDTGELRENVLSGVVDNGLGDDGLLTSSVAFLPGGAGLVATTSFGIQLVDLSGHAVATLDLPPGADLMGVGLSG